MAGSTTATPATPETRRAMLAELKKGLAIEAARRTAAANDEQTRRILALKSILIEVLERNEVLERELARLAESLDDPETAS